MSKVPSTQSDGARDRVDMARLRSSGFRQVTGELVHSASAADRPTPRGGRDRHVGGLARRIPAVLVGTALTLAALAAPAPSLAANCNTPSHQASLSRGGATPGTGTPSTMFAFTVDYTDNAGCVPSVSLIVNGLGTFAMKAASTGGGGRVTYRISRSLPTGSWTYRFEASSGSGGGFVSVALTAVTPGRIGVADSPPPTSRPTPKPKPPPTPKPTAPPTSAPPPKSTPKPAASAAPGATPPVAPTPSTSPAPMRSPRPAATPRASAGALIGGGGAGGGQGHDGDGPFGGLAGFLALGSTVVHLAEGPYLPITSWVASCLLGLLMYAIVIRRRRETDDGGLRFAVALPLHALPAGPGGDVEIDDGPIDAEATIPRWRRPSVQAARQSRLGTDTVSLPIRFTTPPRPGDDRRVVGYRLVRVADSPDEIRSAEVGRFDRGDEVDVLETLLQWTRVRGANGLEGWVPTQTVLSSAPGLTQEGQPGR